MLGDGQEFRLVLSISSSFYTDQLFVVLFTLIKYLVSISTVCIYVYVFWSIGRQKNWLQNADQKEKWSFT